MLWESAYLYTHLRTIQVPHNLTTMDAQGSKGELDRRFAVLSTSTIAHDIRGSEKVEQLPFVKTIIKQSMTPRQSSAGAFEIPLEIQQQICNHLDFESILKLSRTSFAAKIIVDSVFPFTEITSKAPRFLKAIAELGLMHVHSVATIAHVLSSYSCDLCPNFGSYFFPLTGSRCCFFCLSTEPEFSLIRKTEAIECFGSSSIRGLPSIFARKSLGTIPRTSELVECFSAQKVVDMCNSRRYKTRQYHTASGDQLQPSQHRRNWEPDQSSAPTYAVTVRMPLLRDPKWPRYMGGYYCGPCIRSFKGPGIALRHSFWLTRVMDPRFGDGSARKIEDKMLNLPVRTIDEHFKHTETCANARAFLWQERDYISGKK
ncbi:hypothetical protein EAE96_002695 [Botrytis aclada]|nr:hypothetical protein EAE96_002695 [Botrytis aclada]